MDVCHFLHSISTTSVPVSAHILKANDYPLRTVCRCETFIQVPVFPQVIGLALIEWQTETVFPAFRAYVISAESAAR